MKGIILDRDGTLIDFHRNVEHGVVTPAFHPDHVRLLPGVVSGLSLLRDAGFVFAIATNQPDAAKGRLPLQAIERTNQRLCEVLAKAGITIAAVHACTHHPDGGPGGDPQLIRVCACRKPQPGMLNDIVTQLDLERGGSWMIGDTPTDAAAAASAGLRMGLIMQTARCELCPFQEATPVGVSADVRGPRLEIVAQAILDFEEAAAVRNT